MGLWQKLNDALPWNQRRIQETHAERERELNELPYEPPPPAASAAEAMADMRRRNTPARPQTPAAPEEESAPSGGARKAGLGTDRSGNEALRDFARKKGV